MSYNKKSLSWRHRRYMTDGVSYRIGPARIRQLRVEPGQCLNHRIFDSLLNNTEFNRYKYYIILGMSIQDLINNNTGIIKLKI